MENEALVTSTTRHSVYLERLKTEQVNRFAKYLKEIDRTIRLRLSTKTLTDFRRARLERLLSKIEQDLTVIFDKFKDEFYGEQQELALYESGFEARNLNAAATGSFEAVIPSGRQIKAAIFSAPLSVRGADGGKLLKPFVDGWTRAERGKIIGAIRQGYFEGQTTQTIVQSIRGTRAKRYTDGLLGIASRNARAIVRTAVQHVASTARAETWKENVDIIKGYRWVSTLDSRTTTQCQALDGKVFKTGKGPLPPIHIQCRSTTVAELDKRFAFLSEGRTRSSADGGTDGSKSYYEWLKGQPEAFQVDALGKSRAKLFREGGLSADRFSRLNLDRDFKPLTLAEMKEKEPIAFIRAFGNDD